MCILAVPDARGLCFVSREANQCRSSRPREDTRNDTKELRGSRGANNRHVGFFVLVFACVVKASRPFQVFKHLPKSFYRKNIS